MYVPLDGFGPFSIATAVTEIEKIDEYIENYSIIRNKLIEFYEITMMKLFVLSVFHARNQSAATIVYTTNAI